MCMYLELSTVWGLACERSFTYNIFMTRDQYIKILQKELARLNKQIDFKIMNGESYGRLAREHKLVLRKIHQHYHKSPFMNLLNRFASIKA